MPSDSFSEMEQARPADGSGWVFHREFSNISMYLFPERSLISVDCT